MTQDENVIVPCVHLRDERCSAPNSTFLQAATRAAVDGSDAGARLANALQISLAPPHTLLVPPKRPPQGVMAQPTHPNPLPRNPCSL